MSDSDLYGDAHAGNTQVDFSFLDFNTQVDSAFNDLPETVNADQVCYEYGNWFGPALGNYISRKV